MQYDILLGNHPAYFDLHEPKLICNLHVQLEFMKYVSQNLTLLLLCRNLMFYSIVNFYHHYNFKGIILINLLVTLNMHKNDSYQIL